MNESLLSVVAPLEADVTPDGIEAFVEEVLPVLRGLVRYYEIILVDDGAPEETVEHIRGLLSRYDFLRFLRLSRHFGEETAVTAGLESAVGDYMVVMLPNMDPPALIPQFYEAVRSGADIVYGVRLHRKSEPFWYRLGARVFYWYMNTIVRAEIPPDSTQFRCMSRQVVNAITQVRGADQYLRLITSYIGFRKKPLAYAPINRTGAATVRPKREAAHLARTLITDQTTQPLRTVLWVGVILGLIDLVIVAITTGFDLTAAAMQIGILFFVVAGMLAVIGEYVGALSRRLRDRPSYYVREEHTSAVLLREERKNVVDITGI